MHEGGEPREEAKKIHCFEVWEPQTRNQIKIKYPVRVTMECTYYLHTTTNFHARLELNHVQKTHPHLSHLRQWKQLGGGVTPNGDYYDLWEY